jgi:2-C-methyl-D-erythritol 4-phosphate cytidylyltransferase
MAIAILLAAGVGSRANLEVPKQFTEVFGRPLFSYPLDVLQRHPQISEIVIVCLPDWISHMRGFLDSNPHGKVSAVVAGGSTAQNSAWNGVKQLLTTPPQE